MKFASTILLLTYMGMATAATPPVVSDTDLVMTRQTYGETRRNLSIEGKPLTIAGQTYKEGIGTHAASMIPINTPGGYKDILCGSCGIDDEAAGGSVRFRIMSGTNVLWESPLMKKGMPAAPFEVTVPVDAKKLYLMADDVDGNDNDHADWVNLRWKLSRIKAERRAIPERVDASAFGLKPGIREDQTEQLRAALSAMREGPWIKRTLVFPKGEYHFYADKALRMSFHISNHDQPVIHPVGVPLADLGNVTIEGNGSLFVFHGSMLPLLVMDSSNVTVNNLAIDFERPIYSEAKINDFTNDGFKATINPKAFPYQVSDGKIQFIGEGWNGGITSAIAFRKGTNHIVEGTSDIGYSGSVEDLGKGNILFKGWDLKSKGLLPGDTLTLRTWGRPHPASVIYRAKNTTLNNVAIHHSFGMALLAQRSENIHLNGGGVFIRKGTDNVSTSGADATHYSNCKGLILSENGLYEGMMDDAINVHSTCLGIQEIINDKTLRCKYMHGQSVGFEVFLPGETLRFIAGPTLEPGEKAKVAHVRKLSTEEVLLTLTTPIPSNVRVGDAVENGDYYPAVTFRNNTVRNNRARGSLFTTPKRVIVENNNFDHSSGSAILLAGDAQGWYESGACEDVLIRNNTFTNNLTSRYQFTEAVIAIYPEVRQLQNQKEYYHRNVRIENNVFHTFDVPLLFAISTQNLLFKNNKITYNNDFKGWGKKPFIFRRCADIRIIGNQVTPTRSWNIGDCDLQQTPESEVSFK